MLAGDHRGGLSVERFDPGDSKLLGKIASGDLIILSITPDDVPAIAQVIATYSDQTVDFADACLVHLAERETLTTIFTVDRRHFSVYRTASGKAFTLLPE